MILLHRKIYIFTCASRFRLTSRCAICHISLLVVFCVCSLSKEKKHTIRWHWIPMCTAKLTTRAQCETEKSMWLWELAKTYRERSAEYFHRRLKVFVRVEFGILYRKLNCSPTIVSPCNCRPRAVNCSNALIVTSDSPKKCALLHWRYQRGTLNRVRYGNVRREPENIEVPNVSRRFQQRFLMYASKNKRI